MDAQTLADAKPSDELPLSPPTEVAQDETPKATKGRGKRAASEKVDDEEGKRSKSSPSDVVVSVERPSRERKAVERFSDTLSPKTPPSKVLSFQQGPGKKLKEIPNVLFKVSKRKSDDTLQTLHTLLFGKKTNVHSLKRNILQFSGFVWPENEEKQRARMRDRLDKFNRGKLFELCEILDVLTSRSSKKEEITTKLLEFLESPNVTRGVVLAEKQEKSKKKRKSKGSRTPAGGKSTDKKAKKQRKTKKETSEEVDNDENTDAAEATETSVDDEDADSSDDEAEHHSSEQEEEKEEQDKPTTFNEEPVDENTKNNVEPSKVKQTPTKKASSKKSTKSPQKPAPKDSEDELSSPEKVEASSKRQNGKGSNASKKESAANKKNDEKLTSKDKKESRKEDDQPDTPKATVKQNAKVEPKASTKSQGKNKPDGDSKAGPSTEELHAAASNILKEVDFNKATLADILKLLGTHFKIDLTKRKLEIKRIIEDVISNMSDVEEDNEDDEEDATDNNVGSDADANTDE